jgi:nucleotide-binding universal stress UspA family protein
MRATTEPHAPLDAAPTARRDGPVVAVTDGSPDTDAVILAARLLAAPHGAPVRVVSGVTLAPIPSSDLVIPMDPAPWNESRRAARWEAVQEQLDRTGGEGEGWAREVVFGTLGCAAADAATALGARVVVCPLGHHRLVDRLFGDETALHVARHADVPVLAVPAGLRRLPRSAVVAIDFSPFSTRAALAALDVLDEGATIHLAHVVEPMEHAALEVQGWEAVYGRAVDAQFERLRATLRALRPDVAVEVARLGGLPARALLEYGAEIGAELIAAGSHGHGFFARMALGSVSTQLLRGAACSVLVVPPPSGMTERSAWAETLWEFTARNAGRRCVLEVDDDDIGAQVQTRDYPFLGATWDHRDGRLEIMVGDGVAGGRHLTRSVGGVREVEVTPDENGREALRVRHAGGETSVSFPREANDRATSRGS